MESCVKCGRPRKEGLEFCTSCGTRFPEQITRRGAGSAAARRSPIRVAWLSAASVVLLAIIAVGVFLLVNHKPVEERKDALSGNDRRLSSASVRPSATAASSPSPSASPEVAPSASPASSVVTVASAVAGDPEAQSIADFIGMYFSAINSRDYQNYMSFFTAQDQPDVTAGQFARDYRSTTDSDETLTGMSNAPNGDIAAAVTFTSRQTAAESVTGTQTCTDWSVSFYLAKNGDSYLIDQPPAGYHAAYAAC